MITLNHQLCNPMNIYFQNNEIQYSNDNPTIIKLNENESLKYQIYLDSRSIFIYFV